MNQSSALDEEIARAELYGVLSALFYAPPSAELLAKLRVAITVAPMQGAYLEESWQQLVGASRRLTDAQIKLEFDTLFGGIGKPEVYLFGCHYLTGFLNDKPLVKLRTDLDALGLGRTPEMIESEDHLAYLCEVMRFLIAGDDLSISNLTQQQKFYSQHLQPWSMRLCEAVSLHPKADFYAAAAQLASSFFSVETQAFDLI